MRVLNGLQKKELRYYDKKHTCVSLMPSEVSAFIKSSAKFTRLHYSISVILVRATTEKNLKKKAQIENSKCQSAIRDR